MLSTKPLAAIEVDHRLRKALHDLQLAERNAVLWFGEVLERRLFRDLGYSSIYQYAGEALGFSPPRTAQFIRLCGSLKELPALRNSLAAGEVSWTKAREVAKVATPQTESAWVDLARREGRRKLETHVRMAQTRSRARRRTGGRQLGLGGGAERSGLANGGDQHGLAGGADRHGLAGGVKSAEETDGAGWQELRGGAREAGGRNADLTPRNVDLGEVPVTLSLRFAPEQYARYEAILEKLRKLGDRAAREELILAGLETLLVEAEPSSSREAAAGSRDERVVSPRTEASMSANEVAPVSPRTEASMSANEAAPVSPPNLKPGRQIPVYQIIVQQCEDCGRARVQTSRGAKPVAPAAAEAMRCDARVLRPGEKELPGARGGTTPKNGSVPKCGSAQRSGSAPKNRATIPPAVRREVMARDGFRCRAAGCGASRFLEVHHVVPRAVGGTNRPANLVTLCSACHQVAHSLSHQGSVAMRAARRGSSDEGAAVSLRQEGRDSRPTRPRGREP